MSTTYLPNRKIAAAGIGVPISVVLAWAVQTFAGVEIPAEVATAIGGLISTFLGYMVPESA